jgi:hypothetical protein
MHLNNISQKGRIYTQPRSEPSGKLNNVWDRAADSLQGNGHWGMRKDTMRTKHAQSAILDPQDRE